MSKAASEGPFEGHPHHGRPGRRHSLERYRPGGRGRGLEESEGDPSEDHQGSSHCVRGRGRGKAHLAHNDLRHKINESHRHHAPGHSVEYIHQGNINIHSNYHRSNNHHRNEHRYQYDHYGEDQSNNNNNSNQNSNNRQNPNGHPGKNHSGKGYKALVKKNTECFDPSYEPPDMRILLASPGGDTYDRKYSTRDVVQVGHLFSASEDSNIYERLLNEIKETGLSPDDLWQSWHGDSHLIADDKKPWKEKCPTFSMVIEKITAYFKMDVKATRFNWYRDATEWKPYHHDAAAVKPKIAKTQNFTAAVSFGAERDAAFQHAKTKTVIALPQPNGTVYTFGRDVNILWRHGIPQLSPDDKTEGGRISIILWGWIEQFEL